MLPEEKTSMAKLHSTAVKHGEQYAQEINMQHRASGYIQPHLEFAEGKGRWPAFGRTPIMNSKKKKQS